jgi:uncharacterized protein (UPF0333 family)
MNKIFTVAISLLIIIAVGVAVSYFVSREKRSGYCTPIFTAAQSKAAADSLDKQALNLASTTADLMNRSTEGGTQITFTQGDVKKIVEQRFYGETGKSYMRFYFEGNKIFEIVKLNLMYSVPISVDSSGKVKSTEESHYYLDPDGRVCGLDVNGSGEAVDKDTQYMIGEYIAGIQ